MNDIGEDDETTARRYFENGGCPQERCRGHTVALIRSIAALRVEAFKWKARYEVEARINGYLPGSDKRS